jgi:hypothetical protein
MCRCEADVTFLLGYFAYVFTLNEHDATNG